MRHDGHLFAFLPCQPEVALYAPILQIKPFGEAGVRLNTEGLPCSATLSVPTHVMLQWADMWGQRQTAKEDASR
jgi:hypothetical protein